MIGRLFFFTVLLISLIYIFNSLVAKRFKKVDPKTAFLYISAVATVGVFGEVIVGTVYNFLFGDHLWNYRVYPLHNGFTSYYAPIIWGCYGFYLYLSHDTLLVKKRLRKERHLALIFCVETVILEAFMNGLYKTIFGNYLFYYLPNDLWHLSSLRGLPFYFLTGLAIFYLVRDQRIKSVHFAMLNTGLVLGLIIVITLA